MTRLPVGRMRLGMELISKQAAGAQGSWQRLRRQRVHPAYVPAAASR